MKNKILLALVLVTTFNNVVPMENLREMFRYFISNIVANEIDPDVNKKSNIKKDKTKEEIEADLEIYPHYLYQY